MGDSVESKEVIAPQPGTPEYDAAMAAKVDESAAKALEAAGGEKPVEAPKEDPAPEEKKAEGNPEEKSEEAPEGAAKEAVEEAGLDFASLTSEYDEKGALSEESYKALEKAGFPKEAVDNYIAGQAARAELLVMKASEAAGGKEALARMQEWAVNALSPAEVEAYNKAVIGNEAEVLQAITSLRARYEATYGRQPGLLGGSPAGDSAQGYASKAEMTADMRNPLYAKDPAYRAKVAAKVAATTAF